MRLFESVRFRSGPDPPATDSVNHPRGGCQIITTVHGGCVRAHWVRTLHRYAAQCLYSRFNAGHKDGACG